jgi:hypothetical protein
VKMGDLIRWSGGTPWTEEDKQKYCALGLVMFVSKVNGKVGVQWCSHGKDYFMLCDQGNLELMSES